MKFSFLTMSLIGSIFLSFLAQIVGNARGYSQEIVWLTSGLIFFLVVIISLLIDLTHVLKEKQK